MNNHEITIQNNSFIVDPFDEDESTYRNRTTSEGWELSQNEIPVELDIDEHHNQLKQPKGANSPGSAGESDAIKASPETDKTVPVVIRWPWPAKSGFYELEHFLNFSVIIILWIWNSF